MKKEFFVRHPEEASLIMRAFREGSIAVNHIINDLCTADSQRCRVLQDTLHDLNDSGIWKQLLDYLAYQCWMDRVDYYNRSAQDRMERFDQAIVEVFIQDEHDQERDIKAAVLFEALQSPRQPLRFAAAYLLGLRSEPEAIPVLSEMIDKGNKDWKLRSVKALSSINDIDCAQPLMKALISSRGQLHREARRALQNMGPLAEPVWSAALNHLDGHIRWDAAYGLGQIGDSRALLTLAQGLCDDNYVVRWATANLLTQMGEKGVQATLAMISRHSMSEPLRQAAYDALSGIRSPKIQEKIDPLLDGLLKSSSTELLSSIAQRLLEEWESLEELNNCS